VETVNGFEPSSIKRAVKILMEGGVVAFPTETVYGLGADVFNAYAVAKIFEMKRRPRFDPLIVHICRKESVSEIVREVPPVVERLIDRFWPGPLTVILKKKGAVPDIVTAGLETVAVRMPSHRVALRLIEELGRPIAAPSANPFGYMSPTRAAHVATMFKDKSILVLDGGDSTFGIESTIISVQNGQVHIHRHGAVTVEELSEIAGTVEEEKGDGTCQAPGELPYHYAPHKPLRIVSSSKDIKTEESSFLAFQIPRTTPLSRHVRILSERGDMREAAANFFSCLIELDRDDVKLIYAERVPETGIGKAMMERLKKASRKYR
jgi:L-threonylcarbamoyladenylate synthase